MNDNNFFEKIESDGNKKTIAVQGLGFVGSVMSLVCANAINEDYFVLGIDLPNKRGQKIIDGMNNGFFPRFYK